MNITSASTSMLTTKMLLDAIERFERDFKPVPQLMHVVMTASGKNIPLERILGTGSPMTEADMVHRLNQYSATVVSLADAKVVSFPVPKLDLRPFIDFTWEEPKVVEHNDTEVVE